MGTSATLSPSFKGPYVVTTKKSDKQVRLGTVAGGPPLTEFNWASVDRLVAYPWPVGRDAVLDESPLEGWTWAEVFAEDKPVDRRQIVREREDNRVRDEMRKVSIGDWVAGFWSSSWKTEPGRV